jgi:hypothetical protein
MRTGSDRNSFSRTSGVCGGFAPLLTRFFSSWFVLFLLTGGRIYRGLGCGVSPTTATFFLSSWFGDQEALSLRCRGVPLLTTFFLSSLPFFCTTGGREPPRFPLLTRFLSQFVFVFSDDEGRKENNLVSTIVGKVPNTDRLLLELLRLRLVLWVCVHSLIL